MALHQQWSAGRKEIYDGLYGTTFRAKNWRSLHLSGLLCAPFAVLVHVYSLLCLGIIFIPGSTFGTLIYTFIYIPCFVLALWSHYMTWTTDPGAVPKGAKPLDYDCYVGPDLENGNKVKSVRVDPTKVSTTFSSASKILTASLPKLSNEAIAKLENTIRGDKSPPEKDTLSLSLTPYIKCAACNNYKPPRAHHDSVTGRCIVKLDHFCPWVGNAIGALNHKFFAQFIFYTFMTCITSAVIVLLKVSPCKRGENAWVCYKLGSLPARLLYITNAFFFFFTLFMLIDQIYVIWYGQSKVARKKIATGRATEEDMAAVTDDFNEMFGGSTKRIELHWFIPSLPIFGYGMKEKVLGYKWEPSYAFKASKEEQEINASGIKVSGEPKPCPYSRLEQVGEIA